MWEFTKPRLKNRTVLVKMLGESRREHEQAATQHASEQGLEDYLFDILVFNDGTLDDLKWAANYIVSNPPPKKQLRLYCQARTVAHLRGVTCKYVGENLMVQLGE